MKTIRELLSRDLSQPIEEVIKVDQQDEQTVYHEITEYVATDRIKRQYQELLAAIAEGPGAPTEGVGVWISGFFGSGKSSFAKNLGYVIANREVLDQPAADLFVRQLEEQEAGDPRVARIRNLLDYINSRLDVQVIMFDVQVDRAVRRHTEPIAEVMYTVLLRELDYAQDYDLAELEIELEAEGRLKRFVEQCAELYGGRRAHPANEIPITLAGVSPEDYGIWRRIRKGAQRIQRASAVLHQIDPETYPTPDSWAASIREGGDVTIRTLVDRTFELTARRRPGHAVVFIIDEVGQYVARSAEKIENLRAVVEHFGQESKNRVLAGRATAPVWVVVTSQEKLDEVVAAIDDKRVDLAKLQDRFRIRIDMAPADIREVATRRVLAKAPGAEEVLGGLYDAWEKELRTHTQLERTTRSAAIDRDAFVQYYPYLPYFVDLSIDVVSGLRQQPGAPRHIGGSNRTIIKQAYEMLVSERTHLADEAVGTLVTLDRIYDLIEGNLPSERQKDLADIRQRWPGDPWPARVAQAIALLEYVRDLPRTPRNIATLLYRRLGDPAILPEVERAIGELDRAQFISPTEHGWKLQTAQEKSWAAERSALSATPREENTIAGEQLRAIFSEPALTRYRYGNLRHFRVGATWGDCTLTTGDAQIPLQVRLADGPEVVEELRERTRDDSRAAAHANEIFWVASLDDPIDVLVCELYRSKQMVTKYDQLRAQNKISKEEAGSLAAERSRAQELERRLQEALLAALTGGRGYFKGVAKDGAALGQRFPAILKGMFDYAVPDLYPKLEMGARPLKGREAEEILKAANLSGLSKIFYAPPDGLDLVKKEGGRYVVNLNAPILKEVLGYLNQEHAYGNTVTGRMVEHHFGGLGYGWEREVLWLALATLLRGGAIEVSYQGRRHRNHLDPQVRSVFGGTNAFRSASFAPRKNVDLRTLVTAARRYEAITGRDIDVEETAIARAFGELAEEERQALLPVKAKVEAHAIPAREPLREYAALLTAILNSPSDERVTILAGEGESFRVMRGRVAEIREATSERALDVLQRLRRAVERIWPLLRSEAENGALAQSAEMLVTYLEEVAYYPLPREGEAALEALEGTYRQRYTERHAERRRRFAAAIESVKAHPAWPEVPEETRDAVLRPLAERACQAAELPEGALACRRCGAGLATMTSDLAAVSALRSDVLMRVQELTTPEEVVERVRVAALLGAGRVIHSAEEADEVVEQLREQLHKLLDSGVKVVLE